jgi:hypothetical protein
MPKDFDANDFAKAGRLAGVLSEKEESEPMNDEPEPNEEQVFAAPKSLRDLVGEHKSLKPPIIHGLLRQGETMNIISASKIGKSWLVMDLALAVAQGKPWLGRPTRAGNVLILDNELHPETTADRFPRVAGTRSYDPAEYQDRVFVHNLRGSLVDLFRMEPYFSRIAPEQYKIIVLDAFYRFLPPKTDENDNAAVASLYNFIDRMAERLKCAFVLIHHSSKGDQGGKSITDVGSGAGSQSRAADCHFVLRHHEIPGYIVADAAPRSWPPVEAFSLRWDFPVWNLAPNVAPELKTAKTKKSKAQAAPPVADDVWRGGE